jgi:REP element-mobilizing transposase RayT
MSKIGNRNSGRQKRLAGGQTEFVFNTWGGRRKGAGRKRRAPKPRVPHVERPVLAARYPVHVTLDFVRGMPSLRSPRCIRVVWQALADSARRQGFRVTQFSVQDRHLHLMVEAHGKQALSRGMLGLKVRLARRLNRRLGRSGAVFADRYHARILRTPKETYLVLRYVLCNSAKHLSEHGWRIVDTHFDRYFWDSCCTAAYFDGWRGAPDLGPLREGGPGPPPVAPARTWLQTMGWRRYGLLDLNASPGTGAG